MWWFAAAHANLLTLARQFAADGAARDHVLDAGCGTGGLLAKLAADRPQATVVGLDADQQACGRAAAKSARPYAAVRSTPCPSRTRACPRSLAPMSCAIAMSTSGRPSCSFIAA